MSLDAYGLPALTWRPSPNFYPAPRTLKPQLIVIHDTEGGYAGAIATFANTHSQVSAHIVLKEDGSEATQMVPWARVAWHVVKFNGVALGIEMAGFEKQGYLDNEWQSAARITAYLAQRFKIPVRWVTGGQVGICRHYDLGKAGGGHTDPTLDPKVWNRFIERVTEEAARGNFPDTWGR